MFPWNFAKSAEAMFSRWAVKKVCKFFLKKKLGQLILGDIDLNQLDIQLTAGIIQLSDLALNVDYINQKFGAAAMLAVKEGSIGSLSVKLPWNGNGCQIEVDELELVLTPNWGQIREVSPGASVSGQDSSSCKSHDVRMPGRDIIDSTLIAASKDVHEGVKTIAKMVKWLLTSFHVKIKKLIVAFESASGGEKKKEHCRTLVLRISEVECGTGISEDGNPDCRATVDSFLGLSRLTNFVKFQGAVLEFLHIDGNDSQNSLPSAPGSTLGEWFFSCCPSSATTPVITGKTGGFSGTIKLSIPWKNGSLDIRKVDADVYVDPLEIRFQPSSIKCFLYILNTFEEMDKNCNGVIHNEATESVYYSASSHSYSTISGSSEFAYDKVSQNPEKISAESYTSLGKDTGTDALLQGSHLISDWVTSPLSRKQTNGNEESDFGASVDQFFECFDGLRNSQSALGNSGMWNWTCSVFSAITAASNLASGSLRIPAEQKHAETNLKARIAGICILFSFLDEDPKHSCDIKGDQITAVSYVHYISVEFEQMQLVLRVSPRELNFEATVNHIEVADHFSNGYDAMGFGLHGHNDNVKTQIVSIRNMQAAVQAACPPLFSSTGDVKLEKPREYAAADDPFNKNSTSHAGNCRGIYRDDVLKVMLLQTSAASQVQFMVASVSPNDTFTGPKSFSLKLPSLVFWVNFHLISMTLDLIKEIGNSLEIDSTKNFTSEGASAKYKPSSQANAAKSSSSHVTTLSAEKTLRGNIFLLNARVIFCFPCEKSEDARSYSSFNQFIALDFSSSLDLSEEKGHPGNPIAAASPKDRCFMTTSDSLHLSVGNLDIYSIASAYKAKENKIGRMQKPKYYAEKILSIADRRGRPSVFAMFWQDGVTGPWIVKKAKVIATSDGMSYRNKFMGKGYESASVTTIKDMEDFNSQTRKEIVLSSAFFLHVHLSPLIVNLDSSQYVNLHYLLNEVADWSSCITSNPVGAEEKSPGSQTSILVECDSVEISVSVEAVENIKRSIQNELPGSWHGLKLKLRKVEFLSVSNIGAIPSAKFLWMTHSEGDLWGSITGVPDKEFLLISCENSSRERGNGEGSNVLSSRCSGSDIVHLWDPDNFGSHVSVNIRCGTIVAIGGRVDWFDTITSFFSLPSPENVQSGDNIVQKDEFGKDKTSGSSFVLNLIDIGLSYEPYFDMVVDEHSCSDSSSTNANGKMRDHYVSGLLAASSFKLSNVMVADSVDLDYEIEVQDLGLLLCAVSVPKNVGGFYSAQDLRKTGYVKVAGEAHVEALLRMSSKNDNIWELECSESHIVLDTCQDTTFGLVRLAAQLQQLYAPDVEESIVHLQTRWDNVQQAHENDEVKNLSRNSVPSTSQTHASTIDTKMEPAVVNLLDQICEGAFHLDGNCDILSEFVESEYCMSPNESTLGDPSTFSSRDPEHVSHNPGAVPGIGFVNNRTSSSETSSPEFIEGYFLSDQRPLSELSLNKFNESLKCKSRSAKDGEARGINSGWYRGLSFKILENHVLHVGEKTNSKQLVESETPVNETENGECGNVKGRVLFKNTNVRWSLYGGFDWRYIQKSVEHANIRGRDTSVCLELAVSGMDFEYDIFPDGEISVSRLSLSVQDFRLNDYSKDAPWKLVLGYYQSKDHPRESFSKALKLDLEVVRPHPLIPLEEYRLRIALLPMRLHLHQCQLDFMINFFGGKSSSVEQSPSSQDLSEPMRGKNRTDFRSHNITEEALLPYFQKFDIWPVLVRVDYSPSRVDLPALRRGKYVELVNLVPWKGVELQLKHVQAVGVYGWSCVCETIIGEWLEDISQNQIHKLLKGLPPIRSLVAVGSGAAKLVSLPVKNYKEDQRILKGMQRGTIAFLRSISLEAIGLGVHLAAGAHDVLLQAEYILSSNPPPSVPRPLQSRAFESITDGLGKSASSLVQTPLKKYQRGAGVGSALATAVQAAPAAAIAPASAAARAMHCALLGVRNSLDPQHKKDSMDKYLGTSQSRPR